MIKYELTETKIDSKEKLLELFDSLHDATVKEDEILYTESDRMLKIEMECKYALDKNLIDKRRVFPFIRKIRYPIIRLQINLSNINTFKKYTKDNSLKTHTFNECQIRDGVYVLIFCEVLKIELSFLGNEPRGVVLNKGIVEGRKISEFTLSYSP